MYREEYTDRMLVEHILKGDLKRDQALKHLLFRSNYASQIRDIVLEGGGDKEMAGRIVEDCIILFDRKVRRFECTVNTLLDHFFREEAKRTWCGELMTNKPARDKVLSWINADDKLKRQIFGAIRQYNGRQEDAEDCYQNGYVLLDKNLLHGKYRGGAMKGYFYQLCFNLWRNEIKKMKAEPTDNENVLQPVSDEDPSQLLERKERSELLHRIFQSLNESCRKIIQLKYFIVGKLSMEEIAVKMDLKNAQNAANALSKCRKKLWELMDKHKTVPV